MTFGSMPMMASAAPGDDAEAFASFLNADLLPIDAADLGAAYASFPTGPAADAEPFNAQALETLGLDLELIGGGLLRVPLLTDGSGPGLLNAGELGAITGYAATASPVSSIAASGAVGDDGTIAVSTDAAPGDFGNASLNLTDLLGQLGQLGVAEVTDALIDEAALEIGALASRAEDLPGQDPTSDYRVTDLGIELHSPAVAAIAQTLRDSLTAATTGLTEDLTALAGPGGAVTDVVDLVSDINLLNVVTVSLGDAEVAVTPPNLTALVDDVLGGPGAIVVSDDGAVTIDLTDGSISVDLANLVNPFGPNLNGLPANTDVLTTETIEAITGGVTNALGKVVGNVTAGLDTALRSTGITISLDVTAAALGTTLIDAPVLISGTLEQFAAGTATVDTSGLTLLPGVPLCLGATVAGVCVGLDVNTVLQPVLGAVVDTLVPTVLAGVVGPLADVVTATSAEITGALDGVIADVLGLLSPAVDGLLANLVRVTINAQPAVGDLGPDSFTVRALSVDLLPYAAGTNVVSLDLASSTVTALAALPGPMLTGLTPAAGPVTGGTGVTVTGTDLADVTEVTVDGVAVPFTPVSATELTFETPAHAPGTVDVVVTSPAGTSNALPFEYVPAPVLATLVPDEGPAAGGTTVTVTGTDLADATEVTVDGEPVEFTQVSDTELTFVTPPHAAGPADVTVETVGGVSDPLVFTYLPAPVLLGLDPDAGPTAGGTEVTIDGESLGGATAVTVDGVPVPFEQVSETEITFETPAHVPGTAAIVVVTGGGTTNALPFEFVAPPAIATLAPDAGPTDGGTLVTVTGTGLGDATGVTVDGVDVPFTQVSDTELTFVTPAHAPGVADVIVETVGGASDPLDFTYVPAPALTALDPDEGPAAGGTPVTATGTDLTGTTGVTVDGVAVPFTQVSDTEVTFTTPAHAPGEADVVVTTVGGPSEPLPFTFVAAPVLAELDPDAGPASGGTTVTITGTDLAGTTQVTIDGQPVAFEQIAEDEVTFVTLPHAPGTVDVTVTAAGGTSQPLPFTFVAAPVITALSPDAGPTAGGTTVTITGTDLGGATEVSVDGVPVPFEQLVDDSIEFVTPAHAAGTVDVTVETIGGESAPLEFTYVPAPDLTSLTPNAGPASGGTEATITGTDLAGAIAVTFDGEPVEFVQVSSTEIEVVSPPHAAGPVDVTVETPGGVSDALTFTYLPAPVLLGIDPDAGPIAGGTEVTLTGEELGDATDVVIGGVPVVFDQVSDTEITFETPANVPGTVDVIVVTDGGTTNALPFEYVAPPALTALTPNAGPTAGGTTVTVTGTALADALAVTVDGDAVTFTQVSGTELTFVTPAHDAGAVEVTVETAGGVSEPLDYTYVAAPETVSLDPDEGPTAGGTLVTIEGTDLDDATAVTIDGQSVAFTEVSDTELEFTTPAHDAGPVDVVVETAGGASDPLVFTYVAAPVITALAPDAGPTDGGTLVTITGTDLADATDVAIDGESVDFDQVSGTELEFTTPAHAAGPVDVVVETAGGASAPMTFTYYDEPALAELDPDAGPASGGTTVTITGTDLGGATAVAVDGDDVAFTQVSDTEITFVTEPHAAGVVDVTVETPGGVSEALPYTYVPAPVLLGLDPQAGPIAGGTLVTVDGEELADATELTIDGVPVEFTQVSDTELTFETPAHVAGTVDVVVTTDGGVTNPLPYTYLGIPVLTAITPDRGPVAGGTSVTLTGNDIAWATDVRVDGESVEFVQGGAAAAGDVVIMAVGETLTFVTPAHPEGPVDVVVETPGGVTNAMVFTYVPEPELLALTPAFGPASGGTLVTIEGTDLGGATAVAIDGLSVPFTQVSDTEVTFVTPPHAAGLVGVTVTTAGGESGPLLFTYLPAPVLLGLAPDQGPEAGGTEVTITGELLADATTVTIDGATVPFEQIDGATIVFTTPAHVPGTVDVVVTTEVGTTNALTFTYLPAGVVPPGDGDGPGTGPGAGPGTGTGTGTGTGSGSGVSGAIASTGLDVLLPVLGGLVLLLAGGAALLLARKRAVRPRS